MRNLFFVLSSLLMLGMALINAWHGDITKALVWVVLNETTSVNRTVLELKKNARL